MGKRLKRVQVAGFKSIEGASVELGSINVLIGANGAGKSNFLASFALLHDVIEQRLQVHVAERGGADALLHFGQKRTAELRIRLDFDPNTYEIALAPAAGDELFFAEETCLFHGSGHSQPYVVGPWRGHKESRLQEEAAKPDGKIPSHVLDSLRSWKIYHFHDTSKSARIKQKHNIDDNDVLRPDAANLAAFLRRLLETHRDAYRRIVAAVRMVAPFFDDFVLRPDRRREDMIQLEWREKGSDDYFNAHALSDGTLRFMCLATLLLQPKLPTAILVDEPEIGLHPAAIQQLAALMKSAATQTQVILSTQSVNLVDQFSPEDVIVVDREGSASTFRRIARDEIEGWIDGYALGELWEKNIFGGRP